MKKAQFNFMMDWPELFFLVLFALGFIIVFFAANTFITYLLITVGGLMTGRFLYQKKGKYPPPFHIMIYGFVCGFILALIITHKADWKLALFLFIIANFGSYYMHEKGYISD